MTPQEAAKRAGVRVQTIENWIRRGWLPTGPLGTVQYQDVLAASTRSVELYGDVEPPSLRHKGHRPDPRTRHRQP